MFAAVALASIAPRTTVGDSVGTIPILGNSKNLNLWVTSIRRFHEGLTISQNLFRADSHTCITTSEAYEGHALCIQHILASGHLMVFFRKS
jgi:hypothetical protein